MKILLNIKTMRKNYTHLTKFDRQTIQIQLERWATQIEIANILHKHKSTVGREIDKNSVLKRWTNKRIYLASEADLKSYLRRYYCKTQSMKINLNSAMKLFIIYHLKQTDMMCSPKIIAQLWNKSQTDKRKYITHTSIYSWLETAMWNKYKKLLLFKYKWYSTKKKVKWSKIIWRIWLEHRPEWANNRTQQWHFEADLVVSKKGFRGSVLTLIDRKTKLPIIFKLKCKESAPIMRFIASVKEKYWIKTVTFDNGMEFAKHQLLNKVWIATYFSDPYSPWQKGSIENLNRIIRRFFPKWTIFDNISSQKIRSVCKIIANTPREILGFLSPNQVHFQ